MFGGLGANELNVLRSAPQVDPGIEMPAAEAHSRGDRVAQLPLVEGARMLSLTGVPMSPINGRPGCATLTTERVMPQLVDDLHHDARPMFGDSREAQSFETAQRVLSGDLNDGSIRRCWYLCWYR